MKKINYMTKMCLSAFQRGQIAVCLVFLLTFFAPALQARTISVPGSAATIKAAMLQARNGDIILVSCGTYNEHDIYVKPGVAIWSGTLQPDCVTIDAQGKGRVFVFANADTSSALVGLTIAGGKAQGQGANGTGGAIICESSSPRISSCVFSNNQASNGGAIYCDMNSAPRIDNCSFTNNSADFSGGAICFSGNSASVIDCSINNNSANLGGGIACLQTRNIIVRGSRIINNNAGNSGGGIFCRESVISVQNTVLASNWGGLGGGAVASVQCLPIFSHCTFYSNEVEYDGAALACDDSSPTLDHCIIANSPQKLLRYNSDFPRLTSCNLYGNRDGDWTGPLASQKKQRKNFSNNPLFCAPKYGNFYLDEKSPCIPANSPVGCDNIVGAYGAGCSDSDTASLVPAKQRSGFSAVRAGF